MWDLRECNMARKAMWQRRASPRGAQVARTRGRATRVHGDAQVAPRGMNSSKLASDGPTSIVGPRQNIGVITQ